MIKVQQRKLTEQLRTRADQMEAEIFLRAKEVQEANRRLETANQELARLYEDLANAECPIPGFLVEREWRLANWRGALAAFWLREPDKVSVVSANFSDSLVETRGRLPKRALSSSILAHVFLAVLCLRVPLLLRAAGQRPPQSAEDSLIRYDIKLIHFLKTLPSVKSPEPGGSPRAEYVPNLPPTLEDTPPSPRLTVVLTPPRLNNRRQTVIQPSSPDLHIAQDLSVASMLMGNPVTIAKPKMDIHLWAPRNASVRYEAKAEAPALKASAARSDFPVALVRTTNGAPRLSVPLPAAMFAGVHMPPSTNQAASHGGGEPPEDPGAAGGLLVKGVNPSEVAHLLALPPGSPAAPPDIAPSTALLSAIPREARKGALTVFTGPIGGGGLGVYGALRGAKIYSMFLLMPGKSWVLQYCLAEAEEAPAQLAPGVQPAQGAHSISVQLGQGLAPPEPVERFDFQRVPVPEEKADKLIVLQGVIRADGSISDLKLYRGVQPEMDQAALAAFGRWRFKPALWAGLPIDVDILVGIPARVPKS